MILEIDMGNTRLKWRLKSPLSNLAAGSIPTGSGYEALRDSIGERAVDISRVLVASVRTDEEESALADWARDNLGLAPEFARSAAMCGLVTNGYADPSRLGVDRWLAILAGYHQIRDACVIVSAGTALTVDLVAHDGCHLGGYIAPGFTLFNASLSKSTSKVNVVDNNLGLSLSPGDTTVAAVNNACAVMIKGLIDNGLNYIKTKDKQRQIHLLLTGGDAGRVHSLYPWAQSKQELVLDGLSYVFAPQSIISGEGR